MALGLDLAYLNSHGQPISASLLALLLSSNYAVEFVIAPAIGGLSDRYGRKPFMLAGPLFGFAAIHIYAVAASLAPLFLARALEGAAAATLTPAALGFLGDATSGTAARRGRTMSFFEIATLLGIASGYVAGGVLWQRFQLNAFRLASLLYLAAAAVVWLWLSSDGQTRRAGRLSVRDYVNVIRKPAILRFAPAWLCVTAVLGVWFTNTVYQLSGPHRPGQALAGGMSGNAVSAVLGMFTLTLIAGTYMWSRLFVRFGRKTSIMLIALAGMFAVCVDLLLVNHRG
ncbi:MAG: MFS transporter, partial [Chloroflexota bacterium]|nr:MFS transporter [Chloroflexota bacterium]